MKPFKEDKSARGVKTVKWTKYDTLGVIIQILVSASVSATVTIKLLS